MKKAAIKIYDIDIESGYRSYFLKLLKKLVETETPPANASSHQKIFSILQKELERFDYDVQLLKGNNSGGQLYARPKTTQSNCYQMLLGHVDTVWPKGTLKKMPFNIEDNILTGPGIYDMKAGIAMMLTALKIIRDDNKINPEVSPILFLNSDEESGSTESASRVRLLARPMNRVFVLEPSLDPDGKIKTRRKGVGHFDIIIKGVSSHAGIEPEKGRSAILELSYLIQKLHKLNDPENGVSVNVGTIDGGISTNVVAAESRASVDVRVQTKADAKRLTKAITSMVSDTDDVTLEIKGGFRRPPLVQNKRNRALWNLAQEIGNELGLELKEGTSGGGSDGSFTSLYTATLDGLGAVGDGAHSPTERVFLNESLDRIPLIVNLLIQPPLTD
ncbi:M20/M25/M40 family metallo-hydrolase [Gracilimonas sp. Q87]|uniref:M20/M25/M40 family metallo-hydrolase n=1 Tax=Gracilimonas sp. Q87 TaxID=3384766 RepID=UPI00398440B4